MIKLDNLLALLESFEKSYISPSAAMAIKDAREMLSAQDDEISYLRDKVFELEGQLASSKLETKIVEKVAVKKPKKVK
jgi:hypothetical protein